MRAAAVALLALAACAPVPERPPVIQTQVVRVPVPVPCPIQIPTLPNYLTETVGKSVLEMGNAVIAELEEVRASFELLAAEARKCSMPIEVNPPGR